MRWEDERTDGPVRVAAYVVVTAVLLIFAGVWLAYGGWPRG